MEHRERTYWAGVSVRVFAQRDYVDQYHVFAEADDGAAQHVLDRKLAGMSDDPCGSSAASPLIASTARDVAGWVRSALPGAHVVIDLPL